MRRLLVMLAAVCVCFGCAEKENQALAAADGFITAYLAADSDAMLGYVMSDTPAYAAVEQIREKTESDSLRLEAYQSVMKSLGMRGEHDLEKSTFGKETADVYYKISSSRSPNAGMTAVLNMLYHDDRWTVYNLYMAQ